MKRKKYLTREEKALDLVIGFVGFLVFNVVICLLLYAVGILVAIVGYELGGTGELMEQVRIYITFILPWVINIGLLVFFGWWRSWIAIGALFAMGFLLMLHILTGICGIVACLMLISIAWLTDTWGGY